MTKLYAYAIDPVDTGWENFKTVSEVIKDMFVMAEHEITESLVRDLHINSYAIDQLQFIINRFNFARIAAVKVGWEGDMRGDPVVVPIVQETDSDYGFMWKQDNNGDTFVVFPREDINLLKSCRDHAIVEF